MKEKFGFMACEGCKADGKTTRCLVRANSDTGTLSHTCDECDKTYYATTKEKATHSRWMRNIERIAPPAAPKPEARSDPKPAEKKPDAKPAPKPAAPEKGELPAWMMGGAK